MSIPLQNGTTSVSVPEESLLPHIVGGEAAIREMLHQNYGITVVSLQRLNGYDDLNYHISAKSVGSNPHLKALNEEEFFLKISNLADSTRRPGLLHAICELLDHLRMKGVKCQETIKGIDGDVIAQITSPNLTGHDITYMVNVRTFLPGQLLVKVKVTRDVLFDLGVFVAMLSKKLESFQHPFFMTYDFLWDLQHCPKILQILHCISNETRRKMCADVIHTFESDVIPISKYFNRGQIHGDLNEHNILFDPDGSTNNNTPSICGLLDLGDTTRSCIMYDLAICAAHQMMRPDAEVPVLDIPGYLLAGYLSKSPLTGLERQAFPTCIAARMVMILISKSHTHQLDPGNSYLIEGVDAGWGALNELWTTDLAEIQVNWDRIAQSRMKSI